MRKESAICLRCGHLKGGPLLACPNCAFQPSTPEDQARSLILSRAFDAGTEVVGLTPAAFDAAARQLQSGAPYPYDPKILSQVKASHQFAKAITPRRLIVDLVRWLLLPALLLAGAIWIIRR